MAWLELSIYIAPADADEISDQLTDAGAVAVTMQDAADQPIFEPDLGTTPLWQQTRIVGLFDAEQDMTPLLVSLCAQKVEYRLEPLEDRDWGRVWMEHFKPMQFGQHLWICPSWCPPVEPNAINILLDPGLAFGTGTHPTTALCLEQLDAHPPVNESVIDYGCGSGILAIAAFKLGASPVLAIDHDPQALQATRDNAERNQCDLQISFPDAIEQILPVDLILANILAKPLCELAEIFSKMVKIEGEIILSGILESQMEEVIQCYMPWFTMQLVGTRDGWICLSGKRLS